MTGLHLKCNEPWSAQSTSGKPLGLMGALKEYVKEGCILYAAPHTYSFLNDAILENLNFPHYVHSVHVGLMVSEKTPGGSKSLSDEMI